MLSSELIINVDIVYYFSHNKYLKQRKSLMFFFYFKRDKKIMKNDENEIKLKILLVMH